MHQGGFRDKFYASFKNKVETSFKQNLFKDNSKIQELNQFKQTKVLGQSRKSLSNMTVRQNDLMNVTSHAVMDKIGDTSDVKKK